MGNPSYAGLWHHDFIFIIIHLANFKFYEKSTTMLDGHEVYDVYGMVLSRFQGDLWYVGVYLFFMVAVGLHLSHALRSCRPMGYMCRVREVKLRQQACGLPLLWQVLFQLFQSSHI